MGLGDPYQKARSITVGGVPVGVSDDRHITTVAGSRSGKGRSVIIPNLLQYPGSMVVIDPKGENASITCKYRAEQLGQNVCILDPFKITADHCKPFRKRFNPLTILGLESPTLVEDAGLISDALVVSTNSKDPHWDDSARAVIEALLLHVITEHGSEKPELMPTLLTAAGYLNGSRLSEEDGKPMSLKQMLDEMIENKFLDHRIAGAAQSLIEKPDTERGSIISSARKHMKFLQYDAMHDVLSGHDFNLEDLKTKPTTIYLVLPAMRMNTCKQWLRLFVNLILATVERVKIRTKYPILMVLDEMPILGYMKELEAAIGQIAGLGLRLHCILQDLGQLKALYKDRFETFLGNSGILQFFGNIDQFTCEWVSKYLDKTTIRITEQSANSFNQKTEQGSSGLSYKQQVQELMTPGEVRRFFARDDRFARQLVLIPERRPYILQRANYDQHELFAGKFDCWF